MKCLLIMLFFLTAGKRKVTRNCLTDNSNFKINIFNENCHHILKYNCSKVVGNSNLKNVHFIELNKL